MSCISFFHGVTCKALESFTTFQIKCWWLWLSIYQWKRVAVDVKCKMISVSGVGWLYEGPCPDLLWSAQSWIGSKLASVPSNESWIKTNSNQPPLGKIALIRVKIYFVIQFVVVAQDLEHLDNIWHYKIKIVFTIKRNHRNFEHYHELTLLSFFVYCEVFNHEIFVVLLYIITVVST